MTSLDFELDWFFPVSPDEGYGSRTHSVGSQDGDIFNDQFINLFPSVADVAKKSGKEELDGLCDLGFKKNESPREIRDQEEFLSRKRFLSEPFKTDTELSKNEEWASEYLSEPKVTRSVEIEGQSGAKSEITHVSSSLLENSPVKFDPVKVVREEEAVKSVIKSEAHHADSEIENLKDEPKIRRIGTLPCQTSFCVTQQQIARLLAEDTSADFHAKNKSLKSDSQQFVSKLESTLAAPKSFTSTGHLFRSKSITLPPVKDSVSSTGSAKQESGFSFLRRALTQEKRAEEAVTKPGGKVIIERREEPLFTGLQIRKPTPAKPLARPTPKRTRDNEKRRIRKARTNPRKKVEVSKTDQVGNTSAMNKLHPVLESGLQEIPVVKKVESSELLSMIDVGVQEVKMEREICNSVVATQHNSEFDLLFDMPTPIALPSETSQSYVQSPDVTYAPLLPVNTADKYSNFQDLTSSDFLNAGSVNEPFLEQILSNLLREVDPSKPDSDTLKAQMNEITHDSLSDLLLLDNVFQSHCNDSLVPVTSAKPDNTLAPSPDKSEFALSPNMYSDVSSDGISNSFDINDNSYAENNNNTKFSPSHNMLRSDNGTETVESRNRSNHVCRYCGKVFKDKYSVTVHVRVHSGEKPFPCSLCNKPFRQKAHLAKHFLTHTNPNGRKRKRELKMLEGEKVQKKRKKPVLEDVL